MIRVSSNLSLIRAARWPAGAPQGLLVLAAVLALAAPAAAQRQASRGQHSASDRYTDSDDSSYDDQDSDSQEYEFDSRYDAQDDEQDEQDDAYARDRSGHNPAAGRGKQLEHAGHPAAVNRPLLGLRLDETDRDEVFVEDVYRGSPADRAGVRPGDIVLAINGFEIGSLDQVAGAMRRHDSGQPLEFIVERDGQTREVHLRPASGWLHPGQAIAAGVEEFADEVSQAAGALAGNLQQLSQSARQASGAPTGRPRASQLDRYDRFSYDSEGDQTDLNDETADYSGNPADVIEIDIFAPGAFREPQPSDPQQARAPSGNAGQAGARAGQRSYGGVQASHQQPGSQSRPGDHAALGVTLAHDHGPGVVILGVHPGGPADDAGLRSGDRVLEIDGLAISNPEQLVRYLETRHPGQDVELFGVRQGHRRNFVVMLGERSDMARAPAVPQPGHHWANRPPHQARPSAPSDQDQGDFD